MNNDCQKVLLNEQIDKEDSRYIFCKSNEPIFSEHLISVLKEHYGYTGGSTWCATTSASLKKDSNVIPRQLPVETGCGNTTAIFDRIVGGEPSRVSTWPWIALLGYDDKNGPPFKCGGSLITSRHVLTGAHCIRKELVCVRLGEHNLSIDGETNFLDVGIAKTVVHHNFNVQNGHSDIALILLERNVEFNRHIYPICLPIIDELRMKSFVDYMPFVAGWGSNRENGTLQTILQQAQIQIYNNNICKERFKKENLLMSNNQFDGAVLCGGEINGNKDTCTGDAGGPLMIPQQYKNYVRFYLIGVVSYGLGCARPELPGAYTSTQYFAEWIQDAIAKTN